MKRVKIFCQVVGYERFTEMNPHLFNHRCQTNFGHKIDTCIKYHGDPHETGTHCRGRDFDHSHSHKAKGINVPQSIASLQHGMKLILQATPHYQPLPTAVL